jgi:hypothetical protein
MLRRAFILCSILFWALPAGAADDAASLQKFIEATLAAVRAGQNDKAAALVKPMTLPNSAAWFTNVFGGDVGAKLAAEYNTMSPRPDGCSCRGLRRARQGWPHVRVGHED